jgi:hypothetical protein
MTYNIRSLKSKAIDYCKARNTSITQQIGHGTQGIVYRTAHNTAIKVHDLVAGFERELAIYQRLKEQNIHEIRGMKIPRLVDSDYALYVFEMSIVHVPCVLDFGGAYLYVPDHMIRDEHWMQEKAAEFGDDWVEAQAVIRELEYTAEIALVDVNPGNIKFR